MKLHSLIVSIFFLELTFSLPLQIELLEGSSKGRSDNR
ncbi:hypothetical protein SBV1_2980023 [Verrucomicrobia bacterium]|nr:hypothetical protein SBV1_2980023 [Verrucomicrobiota bacterium]